MKHIVHGSRSRWQVILLIDTFLSRRDYAYLVEFQFAVDRRTKDAELYFICVILRSLLHVVAWFSCPLIFAIQQAVEFSIDGSLGFRSDLTFDSK